MKLAPGTTISDKLVLQRPLAAGGMGTVWVGRHLTLNIDVAVKFISNDVADDDRAMRRFEREASTSARINNPHVVKVFDFGVTDWDQSYIVMELLSGEPLKARLRRTRRLEVVEVEVLVSQLCEALGAAHDHGVVHRDVKPANIFLADTGYSLFAKVLDFGVARETALEIERVTASGAVVGTPHFMSPEQLLGEPIDHRADLWAIAVVAYRSLTGRLPFDGATMPALSVAVNDGTFAPPSARVDVPPEVDAWFKLALCRNIVGRFNDARDMGAAFRQALDLPQGTRSHASRASIPGPRRSRPSRPEVDWEDEPPPSTAVIEVSTGHDTSAGLGTESRTIEAPITGDIGPASATESDGEIRRGEGAVGEGQVREGQVGEGQGSLAGLAPAPSVEPPPAAPAEAAAWWQRRTVLGAAAFIAAAAVLWMSVPPASASLASLDVAAWHRAADSQRAKIAAAAPVASTSPPQDTTSAPAMSATAAPSAPPSATSVAAPASAHRPHPRIVPRRKPDCRQPFVVLPNGDLEPKPECL